MCSDPTGFRKTVRQGDGENKVDVSKYIRQSSSTLLFPPSFHPILLRDWSPPTSRRLPVENPQGLDKLLLRTLPPSLEPQGRDARRSGFSEAIRYFDWTR